jgi:hypothetical protein
MEVHPDGLREATPFPLVADLDADGQQDIVYVHNASDAARIWWGDAGKVLDPMAPVDVPAARGRRQPVAGDFDENGLLDVLYVASDGLWWLPQLAARTFGPARPIEEVEDFRTVTVGDFDRDGHADLVVRFFDDHVRVRRGDGHGEFGPFEELGFTAQGLALAQMTGDAGVDLLTVEDDVLTVREGLPAGGTGTPRALGSVPFATVMSVGVYRTAQGGWIAVGGTNDVDVDAYRVPMRVLMWTLKSNGSVNDPCVLRETFPISGTLADLNGDDRVDVVGAATCGYCTSEYHAWGSR